MTYRNLSPEAYLEKIRVLEQEILKLKKQEENQPHLSLKQKFNYIFDKFENWDSWNFFDIAWKLWMTFLVILEIVMAFYVLYCSFGGK